MFNSVLAELRALGYANGLLQEDYKFGDWFARSVTERTIDAAAFGQTPVSYESACFGVVKSPQEDAAISHYRALGAPIVFEVKADCVRRWVVSREDSKTPKPVEFSEADIRDHFAKNAVDWTPSKFLRAKNIGDFKWNRQLELFAGVIPLHEEQIQEKLAPMLRSALSAASIAYRETTGRDPDPVPLFRLIFALLTAKVFYDRSVPGFLELTPSADALLAAVSKYYKRNPARDRVLNKHARNKAFEKVWKEMIFLNLSVEVLAQIWSKTLVSDEVKKKLGIHRTSRTIVKYIVERIPFDEVRDEHQTVVEPCCGSGAFLIGAMNELKTRLWGHSPEDRHVFFSQHLIGFEKDPFGAEISQLSLTLADFPNPEGWQIIDSDVFDKTLNKEFLESLSSAGVVLCNPPFEDFNDIERILYKPTSVKKPVELLRLILDHLHPQAALGFVMPRNILDGKGYGKVRRRLAERYSSIEVTSLPDSAFDADHEVVLLVAKDALPHRETLVTHRKVYDSRDDWNRFAWFHEVSSEERLSLSPDSAAKSIAIPDLKPVWDHLEMCEHLSDWASLHRGIEWSLPLTKD
ncbi:MAG: SAM-dependent DNA methyltransferase, partial [Planctomycetes bacterium]|nr:SAM-dependent DNA methyltransferase [Planctomycetota bacterium]